MIQKLRVKFITASMLSLALVLLVILGGVNAMSYQKVVRDADRILALHDGVICADGTPEKVITPELLETLYSIKTRLAEAEEGRLIIPLLKEDD